MGLFRIFFAVVATLVMVGLNTYIYRRFIRKIRPLQNYKLLLQISIVLVTFGEILFF